MPFSSCMKELRDGTYCFRRTWTEMQALMNIIRCVTLISKLVIVLNFRPLRTR